MRFTASLRRLPLLAAMALVVGCRDNPQPLASDVEAPVPGEAGLYPSLSVTASKTALLANLSLTQVPNSVELGSYQGELLYDAGSLSFQEASFPAQVSGAVFEVSPGKLRFVGTALSNLGTAPLLTLSFRPGGEITRGKVSVQFEEVTAAGDLADLTQSVKNGVLLLRKSE
jgi:hypothetical protein